MNRKTAIAAAIAITMSLTSGVVALGANTGALGFGGASPVATSAAGGVGSTASQLTSRAREQEGGVRTSLGADPAATTKGEQND